MTGEGAPLEGADFAEGADSAQSGDPAEEEVLVGEGACPYLGMVGDRHGHNSFPSRLHLCHAGEPAHIGLGFQADYCLGGLYPSCARYQRAEEGAAAAAAAAVLASPALAAPPAPEPAAVATPVVTAASDSLVVAAAADTPGAGGPPGGPTPVASPSLGRVNGRPPGRGSSPVVSVLLAVALLSTLVAFAAAAGFIKLPKGGGVAVATTTLTTQPTATTEPTTASITPTVTAPTSTPTAPPSSTPATGEIQYVVATGDTLTSISLKFNVPIDAIIARNGITNADAIQVGQVLIIPLGATAAPSTQTPPPSGSPSPNASGTIYVVQSGDTLSAIATKFNVTEQAILDANPTITDPDKIFIGEKIVIPRAP